MKFIPTIIAALMTLGAVAPQAAAYDFMANGLAYRFNPDSTTVTLTSTSRLSADNYSGLTAALVPESVCDSDGIVYRVTAIDDFAFFGCSTLQAVNIPESVKQIGDRALAYCPSLRSITVDVGNEVYDSRNSCNAVIRSSDNTLIAGCVPTTINLTIRAIGPYAFAGCADLALMQLPSSMNTIGYEAFADCTKLISINLPSAVNEVGYRVFAGCDNLKIITVASGNQRYDSRDDCNGVIETATATLVAGCKATVLPPSVSCIGYEAMSGCGALTDYVVPETVTRIGHYAFAATTDLTQVDLPSTITYFGDKAFGACTGLNTIYARLENPAQAHYYNLSTFEGVDTLTTVVYVPDGTVDLYKATMPWTPFFHIQPIPTIQLGDVNADGHVDITDLNILINIVLGMDDPDNYEGRAYILGNDYVDVSDINALINLML
ncbi:MAG: leucine-rich repeat protein [Muribaculaceae bacterium]|nr:leucine-rich repeat protein [Muribaculaceae bacterium]